MTGNTTHRQYRVIKLTTHEDTEKALNDWTSQGWQLVSYQAAGDALAILHFLVFSKDV